jgi:ABC-type Fe3+ transport system permease subunit
MFGGIATLSTGCFESWEYLGPKVRLAALLSSLLVVIVLGLWRFRRAADSGLS